ncbi:hypothetical protein H9639_12675 [Arthrobacter sp. Sa2CUA1]|uniref:Lipoprotein n=1 Tax=Arthrobacter gallicola TaxID=2762225 RepID=A0ABR8UUA5_9MICC|nr:hypothetical protein [Arthrobacter gallicola]MBD7996154.1 hypothetical protein [Arthrobacter gallicola]
MRFTPKNRTRTAAAAGVIALSLLGATGCSAVNDQATTMEYSPSDGIVQDIGELQLRNIVVVSDGDGEPGRLLGTAANASTEPITFELSIGGTDLSWNIPAGGKVVYDDEPQALVESVNVVPGTGIRAEATAASESATLNIPVVDGQVPYYKDYLPTPEATPSSEATEEATAPAAGEPTGASTAEPTGTAAP